MYDPLFESGMATVEQPRVARTVTGPLGPQKDLRSFLRYLEELDQILQKINGRSD